MLDFQRITLKSIEENNDSLALATTHEFDLWGEISAMERTPAVAADIPEADEVRDKLRLLKGVLQWNLEKEFNVRLWKIRRDLRQAGEALVETQRARRQIDEKMQSEPQLFGDLNTRVEGLSPQIDALKAQVEATMEQQRVFMFGVAIEELTAQKQRLDTYTIQARFALAAIYDRAANELTVGDASQ